MMRVSTSENAAVILAIKSPLRELGVENIQIKEQGKTLKIAYYSQEKVADIKELLLQKGFSAENTLPVLPTEHKNEHVQSFAKADGYKIDIYELQSTADSFNGAHGKYILELHKEFDKSPSPNSFANTSAYITGDFNTIPLELSYVTSNYTTIPKENISYEIPDVRAGPFTSLS